MKSKVNEVEINGVKYVPKDSRIAPEVTDEYVIVRTYSAGVFAGEIVEKEGKQVTMKNARRLWYWDGAASLSQLAMEGTKKPGNCKFPREVAKITLTEVIEIIPCTQQAINSIKAVKIWEA
jgi:hypothetical protein